MIRKFRNDIDETHKILGRKKFFRSSTEDKSKKFRRSIFAIKDIKKGEKFSVTNVKKIRPSDGLSPIYYKKVITKKSKRNIKIGEPINYIDVGFLKNKK